jgi:hypothetical protein
MKIHLAGEQVNGTKLKFSWDEGFIKTIANYVVSDIDKLYQKLYLPGEDIPENYLQDTYNPQLTFFLSFPEEDVTMEINKDSEGYSSGTMTFYIARQLVAKGTVIETKYLDFMYVFDYETFPNKICVKRLWKTSYAEEHPKDITINSTAEEMSKLLDILKLEVANAVKEYLGAETIDGFNS